MIVRRLFNRRRAPGTIDKAVHLLVSTAKHVAGGMVEVSQEQLQDRLDVCNECTYHDAGTCTHRACGCNITRKALWLSEDCPEGYWPTL